MESILTTDSFDAFKTNEGILINEKGNTARKFSLVILIIGAIFLGIGFIDLEGFTAEWITTMFTAVFFYGGIVLLGLGAIVFIVKGVLAKPGSSTFNSDKKELILRGKTIPFSDISPVSMQTTTMMNKEMTAILFEHNGRKKSLISGTVFTDDTRGLEGFVSEINTLLEQN